MTQVSVQQEQSSAMVSFIERAASDQSVDIDKFERLIALKREEEALIAERAYNASMAELQSEMPVIERKGRIVVKGELRSRFAKFEDIQEALKPLLKKHGFSFTAKTKFENGLLHITGIVGHKFGHKEETTMVLPFDNTGSKNGVQAIGSSTAYGKRYVISMLFNVSTGDEDDDGQSADSVPAGESDTAPAKYPAANFTKNLPAWEKAIKAGELTVEACLARIQSKGSLEPGQIARIKKMGERK